MSGARTNRPLWEFSRDRSGKPVYQRPAVASESGAEQAPAAEIEHKPWTPKPNPAGPAGVYQPPERPVVLSTTTIYVGVAVLVILVFGVWGLASWVANRNHDNAARATLAPPGPEPAPAPSTSPREPETASESPPPGPSVPRAQPSTVDSPTPYYTSRGFLTADPRKVGLNYLQLANLDQRWAFKAVDYLTKGGLESFAVQSRVEKGPTAANNPARFEVFVLSGLAKDEYARKDLRERVERQAERLGKAWQKSDRGVSDFSKPLWVKYDGR